MDKYSRNIRYFALFALAFLVLMACANTAQIADSSTVATDSKNLSESIQSDPVTPSESISYNRQEIPQKIETLNFFGSGEFFDPNQYSEEISTESPRGPVRGFTFRDTPLDQVMDFVFGELFEANYTLPANISLPVTLRAENLRSKDQAVRAINAALAGQGYALKDDSNILVLVQNRNASATPISPGLSTKTSTSQPSDGSAFVYAPCCTAPSKLTEIISPFGSDGVMISPNDSSGLVLVRGNDGNLQSLLDTLRMFDVSWFDAASVAFIPVVNVDVATLVEELKALMAFGAQDLEIIANPRLNAITLISARRAPVAQAKSWIARLDIPMSQSTDRLFVYRAKNRPAEELAELARQILGQQQNNRQSTAQSLASGNDVQRNLTRLERSFVGYVMEGLSMTADPAQDTLIAYGNADKLDTLSGILNSIDVPRQQVRIDAAIVEINLSESNNLGVEWRGIQDTFTTLFTDVTSAPLQPRTPGISAAYINQDVDVIINAVATNSKIDVLSKPSLVSLNNETARLQVGDQVPIAVQSAVPLDDSIDTIINQISFRDTGIILDVTPRIRAQKMVELKVAQEVSDVTQTTSSSLNSPTIRRRSFESVLQVPSGSTIVLGGLFSTSQTVTDTGVPLVKDIPVLGNLFKGQERSAARTELVLLITPTILATNSSPEIPAALVNALEQLENVLGTE